MSPSSMSLSLMRSGITSPTTLRITNVAQAVKTITHSATYACTFSRWRLPVPENQGVPSGLMYTAMFESAKRPTRRPPARPAKPWV